MPLFIIIILILLFVWLICTMSDFDKRLSDLEMKHIKHATKLYIIEIIPSKQQEELKSLKEKIK